MTSLARSHVCDGRDLSCLGCAAIARQHGVIRAAMTRDDELDDLTRVRIWNALEPQLVAPSVRAPRRTSRIVVGFGAFAAAAAAVVVLVLALRDDPARTLTVAEGATLSSPIGPHTRAGLVGPAVVDVIRTGPATSIRLRRGTFVADFEGGPDRSLRIEAPGAVIEVVGTLFAVEARAASSCVSVAHGTVRVTTRSSPQVTLVTTGQTFCSDSGARAIEPPIEQLLARHEQTLTAEAVTPARARNDIVPPSAAAPPLSSPPVSSPPVSPSSPRVSSTPTTSPRGSPPVASSPVPTSPSPSPRASPTPPISPRVSSAPPSPRTSQSTPSSATPPQTASAPPPLPPTPATASPHPTTTPPIARPPADELYRAAERALANRDTTAADRALEQLITDYPTSPLGEQALYERARLAHQKRAWASARRHLDRLLALPQPRLVEPARYLVCRIAVEAGDGEATSCLVEYRKAYPRSPHDVDVLGLLIEREHASGGCRAAAGHIDELARLHPRSELARGWRARCEAR